MENILLVLGLAAVAYGVYVLWQKKGDEIKEKINELKNKVQ